VSAHNPIINRFFVDGDSLLKSPGKNKTRGIMSKSTFTILFYARKNQVNRMGKAGIMIRVSVNGESVQFSSKLDIEPELWDATNQKMIGTTKVAREFNALLDDIRTSLRNHYREIEKYEAYVTAEKVRNAFLGITVRQLPHPLEASRSRLPDRRRTATHPSKEDAVRTAGTGTRRFYLFVGHRTGDTSPTDCQRLSFITSSIPISL
jgi:hypothetical protein